VTLAERAADSVLLRTEVRDTGVGISAADAERLFQPFSQVGASSRKHGGTGLGLAISRRLVELMGGRIGFTATPGGVGSTFWFTMRLLVAAADEQGQEANVLQGVQAFVQQTTIRCATRCVRGSPSGVPASSRTSTPGALRRGSLRRPERHRGSRCSRSDCSPKRPSRVATTLRAGADAAHLGLILLPRLGERPPAAAVTRLEARVVTRPTRPLLRSARQSSTRFERTPSTEPAARASTDATAPRPLAGVRVLVAEDNVVNTKLAVMLLERFGCRVQTATTGVEALAALGRGPVDVVLMDCEMPEMDGLDATREIRRRERGRRRTPIIAMTANAMDSDRERCLAAGMDDYLAKPVRAQALHATLERWCAAAPSMGTAPGAADRAHATG